MNCYNSAIYLREALDSVLAQTFSDWEVIFWDNQSSDESSVIFNSYADERFCYYLASEHTLLGHARNLAVEQARGEWVAFLDCDDLWLPEKLAKQVEIIHEEDSELGLVYGNMRILVEKGSGLNTGWGKGMYTYNKKGRDREYLLEGNVFSELLKKNFVPLLSCAVHRSAYWQVGGINSELRQAEDYDLFVKISKDFKVRAVQEVICSYRVHDSNLSHAQEEDSYREAIAIVRRYLPKKDARNGIRSHQNAYAVSQIRKGDVLSGLMRLLFHGNILLTVRKMIVRIINLP
jgi:glycosyltransferase involved in cell wall biosynthesis